MHVVILLTILNKYDNRIAHMRNQCRKAAVVWGHKCLINIDWNFDHQISLSKGKCWYSNNYLHFLKHVGPLTSYFYHNLYLLIPLSSVGAGFKPWPFGTIRLLFYHCTTPAGHSHYTKIVSKQTTLKEPKQSKSAKISIPP